MNRVSYILVLIVGFATILSFFPHAFLGMQTVMDHIEKGEIQEPAANAMRMIWFYSSIMMLVSGVWLVVLSRLILIGSHKARIQVLVLGLGLSVFGMGCTYISKEIDAMFAFTVEGILLILATTVFYLKANHHNHE